MRLDLLNPSKWPRLVARTSTGRLEKWVCLECSYIYDPFVGEKDSDIPPGVPFEALPDDWTCPECGAERSDFFY